MEKMIGNVRLNYQAYSGSDLYSDGTTEDELLEIVKNYSESQYPSVIEERNSWPILYHLSPLRKNVVDWLPLSPEHTVLEIGAGCGAITGCLAEKARKVTCIELSEKRSMINAYRNAKKDNIEILLGNFEDIEKTLVDTYDCITLIGVFEYGEKYISQNKPHEFFLKCIKKHLAPGGLLVIGIENKLGMKYWAGCREDHTNRYFEGIENYPNNCGVTTFSKAELEHLFVATGFSEYTFYYPYPDYKLPEMIYSDAYLPKTGDLDNNIRNYDSERLLLFDESKAFNSVIAAESFPLFANSFLICLTNG